MKLVRMTLAAVVLALAFSVPPSAQAEPSRRIESPFSAIPFADDVPLEEGPRMLGDTFPYIAADLDTKPPSGGWEITTRNLGMVLKQAPQKGGSRPAAIRTGEAAIEAVRLFVSGPFVRTPDTAERLIEAATRLKKELRHLRIELSDYRPKSYVPAATPLPQDKSVHPVEAWKVSFVAMELDRYLQLVHVVATVRANGAIEMERKPLFAGPMTSWQSAVIGEYTDADRRADIEMREEAVKARRAYAKALGAGRDLDTLWVLARVFRSAKTVAEFVGPPDAPGTFRLEDGTFVRFEKRDRKPTVVTHLAANDEGGPGKVVHTFCR